MTFKANSIFRKRGTGYMLSSLGMKPFTGEIRIEEGAFVINNQKELEDMFYKFINDEDFYKEASKICHDYVAGKIGATEKTMTVLKDFLG